ncbi:MAG TPA: multicopper oxidase domain-containing protein [Acidimicrobiia bacterium]|nr:multicopper oxidase domain-containing protein [Acidimicrobiia bacterium]
MNDSSKVFDRLIIFLCVIGVLAMAATLVVAIRGPAAAAETSGSMVDVSLSEFSISGDLNVPVGPVALRVTNNGTVAHNLRLENGPATPDLGAGESAALDLGELPAGSYRLFCTIPGHESAGMSASLAVGSEGEHAGHGTTVDYAAMDAAMVQSILQFPSATTGSGNQLLEPTILADGTKQFEITVAITPWEVEPGKVVDAWTYNGQAPGPAIKVDDGDRVSVVVSNELPMGTDVHFHGIKLSNAMDGVSPITQPLIEPGEAFEYQFTAEGPAVAMYHAHHHAQLQVPNGLFGTLIIGDLPLPLGRTIGRHEIPGELALSAEIPMVLNDAGVIGYSLNGKSFPATAPHVVGLNEWFLVHYYNEGLQIHPMHLHGFPQLVVAKDGFPLDEPYWVDTLNVAPGERFSVLVHATELGTWVWHCHILNHVESETGMFGMVTAVIVEP